MSILVTGASGLLGANFVLTARKYGRCVLPVTRHHEIVLPDVRSFRADLAEEGAVIRLLDETRPSWIVHCAAMTNVDTCEERPEEAYALNTRATESLATGACAVGANMVLISTDSVFDGRRGDYRERDQPAPVNVYARTKLGAEAAVRTHLPSALVVRTNFYGWNAQDKHSLSEWIVNRLEHGDTVPGFTDVVFSPLLATDLSEMILTLMDRSLTGLYHVAGARALSKYEFAVELARVFGFATDRIEPVSIRRSSLRAVRPLNTSLNTDKVRRDLGVAMPGIESCLVRFKAQRESGHAQALKSLVRSSDAGECQCPE
jgi:dTDP-4-dehydrorhamnose reductase